MADFDSFLDRESGLSKYFESAQLYRARYAKFRFRFLQPPIDDSWTKKLIYLDKKLLYESTFS